MLEIVHKDPHAHKSTLDEICRLGARRMLEMALEQEVSQYIEAHSQNLGIDGQREVVRNGKAQARTITTGTGRIEIQAPRIKDKREDHKFISKILPPYLRKSPNIESLMPILYLRGLSTNAFSTALESILGEGAKGLSPASIVSLKKSWEQEMQVWQKRALTKRYVYLWADGVNLKIRLGEDKKQCLLVVLGVREDGTRELVAVETGYRESTESWKMLLQSLIDRGFQAPSLVIADGALGFWAALRELGEFFKETKEQRCWVHRIANVLDCFPKRLQPQVKSLLHDMMYAETKADCEKTRLRFENLFEDKYPKATEKLSKDWERLVSFFDFPAGHWKHIRTTNVIESSFATVKLRTKVTKGAGSPRTATAMAFKLLEQAQKNWRRISAPQELANVTKKLAYEDGILIQAKTNREGAA